MVEINKILFITLSNFGDVVLTLPVLDALKENFLQSKVTVMVGPRAKEIFEDNRNIEKLIIYDKYSRLRDKIKLFFELKKEKFDVVIDLRNTLYGALLPARYRTSPFLYMPNYIRHMKDRNLYRLQMALRSKKPFMQGKERFFYFTPKDRDYIDSILKENGIAPSDKIIVVSPVTSGNTRKWELDKFVDLCQELNKEYKVVLIGTKSHLHISRYIYKKCLNKIYDFTGLTNLRQLAYLLKKSVLLITCDTGTLHLGSYLDIPIVALFGPGDDKRYAPWSTEAKIVKKDIFCRPCQKAQCRFKTVKCMKLIRVEDVLNALKYILVAKSPSYPVHPCLTGEVGLGRHPSSVKNNFKRILIIRTDKIGDVLLSTPVIKALRDNFSHAYIAMMVSPYAKDVVEANPYLDEVIIYDKDGLHKSWYGSMKFSRSLRKTKFDIAIVLHPTNRVHLVIFFAGIPKRVGYNRKLGILLTDRIKHTKQLGEKHELEYNLDLVRYLGLDPKDKELLISVKPETDKWVEELLKHAGIKESDRLLAIHPGASCPSRIWPNERFALVADKLVEKHGFKVLLVAGPKDIKLAQNVIKHMRHPVINLAGKTSVSQLASVIKKCQLFIANDSGPVHIAASLGIPVISIFGRNQKGLSPLRWRPLGRKASFLHKQVGCIECLAHNCVKEFACLKAITVDDVLKTVDSVMSVQ